MDSELDQREALHATRQGEFKHLRAVAPVIPMPKLSTVNNIAADNVLTGAVGKLDSAVLCGFTHDGDFWLASNTSNAADVLWMLEQAKLKILKLSAPPSNK